MVKCEIQLAICIARLAAYPFASLTEFITPVYFLAGEAEGSTPLILKFLTGQNPDSLPFTPILTTDLPVSNLILSSLLGSPS
jgi:hypothetical protein